MTRTISLTMCATALALLAGCSTTWRASAPAQAANHRYVVGAKASPVGADAMIWLCPSDDKQAECEEVEIVE